MTNFNSFALVWFYDNSILSGTKISSLYQKMSFLFYDNSILSGTKIASHVTHFSAGFTITQFFQVLKSSVISAFIPSEFYDNSILSGTKISNSNIIVIKFTIIIFLYHFYLLKRYYYTIFSL